MKQKPVTQRIGEFMEGKGFYIVLFLCVAAIGISGYFLMSGLVSPDGTSLDNPSQQVTGQAQVEVPAAQVTPVKPSVEETPVPPAEPPATEEPQENADPSQATVFTWPVHGNIHRDYSLEVFAYDPTMGDWRVHAGIDIEAGLGAQVMAITAGTVSEIREDALMGTTVVINHGDGLESVYSNLAATPAVSVGDQVTPGSVIGAVGNTAIAESAGPTHLHLEMRTNGASSDPLLYLPEQS